MKKKILKSFPVKGKSIKGSFGHQKHEKKRVKLCFPRLFLSIDQARTHQPFHHRGKADEPKFMREHLCWEQMKSAIQEAQQEGAGT